MIDLVRLREEAAQLGACRQGIKEWSDGSPLELLFIRHLDFCIEHNFPDLRTLRELTGADAHRMGIYTDERVRTKGQGTIVLNGECDAEIDSGGFDCARIWIRHNSRAVVKVNGCASVKVMLLDGARATIINNSTRKVIAYRYGGEIAYNGNVCVKNSDNPYKTR